MNKIYDYKVGTILCFMSLDLPQSERYVWSMNIFNIFAHYLGCLFTIIQQYPFPRLRSTWPHSDKTTFESNWNPHLLIWYSLRNSWQAFIAEWVLFYSTSGWRADGEIIIIFGGSSNNFNLCSSANIHSLDLFFILEKIISNLNY